MIDQTDLFFQFLAIVMAFLVFLLAAGFVSWIIEKVIARAHNGRNIKVGGCLSGKK